MSEFQKRSSTTPVRLASEEDKLVGTKNFINNKKLPTKQSVTVLVVDDAVINRTTIAAMLSPTRYNVSLASSGIEAISIAQQKVFDVILMDICMPAMDGFTTTRILRTQNGFRKTCVLAFTANEMDCDEDALLAAGMDGCVPKPVQKNQLLTLLDYWVATGRKVK